MLRIRACARPLAFALLLAACSEPVAPADDAATGDAAPVADGGQPDAPQGRDAASGDTDVPDANSPPDACMLDADGDGDRAIACGGGDCDDADPTRSSLRAEVCGAADVDEDCDGSVDEGVAVTLHADVDHDGYGDPATDLGVGCPSADAVPDDTDCDDAHADVSPGASELCANGRDDDCDGAVDETSTQTFYLDDDHDGFGVASATTTASSCTPPAGYAANAADCDDARADVFPGNPSEPCNGRDDDCSLGVLGAGLDPLEDADADRHGAPGRCGGPGGYAADDCDDGNAAIHPGATEICDRLDDDCSSGGGLASAEDADDDGFAPTSTFTAGCHGGFPNTDCDDTDPLVHPDAPERCNRIDDDCSQFGTRVEASEDADRDMHAGLAAACTGGIYAKDDCNDAVATTYPGAPELCNGVDDDCSNPGAPGPAPGGVERNEDADGDFYASPGAACTGGAYAKTDCDDTNAAFHPLAPTLAPHIVAPANGAYTDPAPTFRWARAGDACLAAPTYEIAADDSCPSAGSCAIYMPSPELHDASITTTSYVPSASLPTARRVYYHVRECTTPGSCGPWSGIRYLEVGLTPHDLNGDGYADVAIGAPDYHGSAQSGRVYVYYGSASGTPSTPSVTIESPFASTIADPRFGVAVALGDLDGDGYADLVAASMAELFFFPGSATGIPSTANSSVGLYGISTPPRLAFVGDLQNDGYEDLALGVPDATDPRVEIHYGHWYGLSAADATLSDPDRFTFPESGFGASVAGAGDVDGDGFDDLLVGAPERDVGATDAGGVHVFRGPDIGSDAAFVLGAAAAQSGAHFGASVGGADLDGDGYAEVLAGAPGHDGAAIDQGAVFFYAGRGLSASSSAALLADATPQAAAGLGTALAIGDVTSDGVLDLVVGSPGRDTAVADAGSVLVFAGDGLTLPATPTHVVVDAAALGGEALGTSLTIADVNGDRAPDLGAGAPYTSAPELAEGNALFWLGGMLAAGPALRLDEPADRAGAHFGAALASAARGGPPERTTTLRPRSVALPLSRRQDGIAS